MKTIGQVESLWRYPVKSMRGEQLPEAFLGFPGVYGDRLYAFHSSHAPKGFPYLTGREQEEMLLYRPTFLFPDRMASPTNLTEAEALAPGLTTVYAQGHTAMVEVHTPTGRTVPIDSPELISMLRERIRDVHELTLLRSDRAMTDCRPISLFSIHTAEQLSQELGIVVDKRRFRANIYIELESRTGFGEDEFVGRQLQIGSNTVIAVLNRDQRCKMITLDPDTAHADPNLMRHLAHAHDTRAGVYAAVLVEGIIRPGDQIALIS